MAFTVTSAKTFARVVLLKMQLRAALRRTTNISEERLTSLMKGVSKKMIRNFSIYGFDSTGLCRAELILDIDWGEHDLQVTVGKATVAIDEDKWRDGTAIEVDEAVAAFQDFVEEQNLRTEWRSRMSREISKDEQKYQAALSELGLTTAEPVKWAGKKQGVQMTIDELPELHVGLYLSED